MYRKGTIEIGDESWVIVRESAIGGMKVHMWEMGSLPKHKVHHIELHRGPKSKLGDILNLKCDSERSRKYRLQRLKTRDDPTYSSTRH